MIKSMTAYGRGEVEAPGQKWVVELRSLNHRFLELSLNLPKRLWALEDQIRKLIKSRINRGRVEMQLTWETLGARLPGDLPGPGSAGGDAPHRGSGPGRGPGRPPGGGAPGVQPDC